MLNIMQSVKYLSNLSLLKNILIMFMGSAILAISSKIQTPYSPVPVTMQTFAVLLLGITLGYKLAVGTVIIYLVEGLLGLPVFAKGGGYMYLAGPTSGYLIAFVLGAFFSGLQKNINDPIITFFYLLFSVSSIYLVGLLWLWNFMGFDKNFIEVFNVGAKPFLHIEIYKLLILTVLSKQLFKVRKFI